MPVRPSPPLLFPARFPQNVFWWMRAMRPGPCARACMCAAECSSEEVFTIIGSHAIFASGSPFPSIHCGEWGVELGLCTCPLPG